MAGHSHWKNIKRTKDIEAKKKSLVFSRMGKLISLAAKQGKDIEKNPALKNIIEKAKKMNVPKENIEKAIKKGTGELKNSLQEFVFELYGPEGSFFIIEGITDNINRTSAEIKKASIQYEIKIANQGSVKWMFEKKGTIEIEHYDNCDSLEIAIIDSGAEDFKKNENYYTIYTAPDKLEEVKRRIESKNFEINSIYFSWIPKDKVNISSKNMEKIKKMINIFEENEDIQEINHNLEY